MSRLTDTFPPDAHRLRRSEAIRGVSRGPRKQHPRYSLDDQALYVQTPDGVSVPVNVHLEDAEEESKRFIREAQREFLDDKTAKPILRRPYENPDTPNPALYLGTLKQPGFDNINSPDRELILERQAEL